MLFLVFWLFARLLGVLSWLSRPFVWLLRWALTFVVWLIPNFHWLATLVIAFNLSLSSSLYLFDRFVPVASLQQGLTWDLAADRIPRSVASFQSVPSHPMLFWRRRNIPTSGYLYDASVELTMPESESNMNHGMFTIQLDLMHENKSLISSAKRSTMIRYKPPSVKSFDNLVYFFPIYFGIMEFTQTIKTTIIEGYSPEANHLAQARVTIHSKDIQIYSGRIILDAQTGGIRYLLSYWAWTSRAVLFCALFFVTGTALFGLRLVRGVLMKTIWLGVSSGAPSVATAPPPPQSPWMSFLWSVWSVVRFFF